MEKDLKDVVQVDLLMNEDKDEDPFHSISFNDPIPSSPTPSSKQDVEEKENVKEEEDVESWKESFLEEKEDEKTKDDDNVMSNHAFDPFTDSKDVNDHDEKEISNRTLKKDDDILIRLDDEEKSYDNAIHDPFKEVSNQLLKFDNESISDQKDVSDSFGFETKKDFTMEEGDRSLLGFDDHRSIGFDDQRSIGLNDHKSIGLDDTKDVQPLHGDIFNDPVQDISIESEKEDIDVGEKMKYESDEMQNHVLETNEIVEIYPISVADDMNSILSPTRTRINSNDTPSGFDFLRSSSLDSESSFKSNEETSFSKEPLKEIIIKDDVSPLSNEEPLEATSEHVVSAYVFVEPPPLEEIITFDDVVSADEETPFSNQPPLEITSVDAVFDDVFVEPPLSNEDSTLEITSENAVADNNVLDLEDNVLILSESPLPIAPSNSMDQAPDEPSPLLAISTRPLRNMSIPDTESFGEFTTTNITPSSSRQHTESDDFGDFASSSPKEVRSVSIASDEFGDFDDGFTSSPPLVPLPVQKQSAVEIVREIFTRLPSSEIFHFQLDQHDDDEWKQFVFTDDEENDDEDDVLEEEEQHLEEKQTVSLPCCSVDDVLSLVHLLPVESRVQRVVDPNTSFQQLERVLRDKLQEAVVSGILHDRSEAYLNLELVLTSTQTETTVLAAIHDLQQITLDSAISTTTLKLAENAALTAQAAISASLSSGLKSPFAFRSSILSEAVSEKRACASSTMRILTPTGSRSAKTSEGMSDSDTDGGFSDKSAYHSDSSGGGLDFENTSSITKSPKTKGLMKHFSKLTTLGVRTKQYTIKVRKSEAASRVVTLEVDLSKVSGGFDQVKWECAKATYGEAANAIPPSQIQLISHPEGKRLEDKSQKQLLNHLLKAGMVWSVLIGPQEK